MRVRLAGKINQKSICFIDLFSMEYKIKDNEILLLDSFMKPEYFAELKTFNTDNYVQNITYDIAIPDPNISQNYSNKTELNSP